MFILIPSKVVDVHIDSIKDSLMFILIASKVR